MKEKAPSQRRVLGRVARIRVSPRDAIGVAHVMERLGFVKQRFSFDQACRIALSSLMASARASGAIPEPSGFEYTELMEQFRQRQPADEVRQLELAATLNMAQAEHFSIAPVVPETPERKRKLRRLDELSAKHEIAPESFDEHEEMRALVKELFPDSTTANATTG